MNQRLTQLMEWLNVENIDAAFITSTDNVFYLSGFRSDPHERLLGVAVFREKEPFLVCPAMEKNDAKNAGWEYDILDIRDTDNPWDLFAKKVHGRIKDVHTFAIEKEHLNVERYEALKQRFSGATFVAAEEKLRTMRLIKDKKERQILREAAAFADLAVETGIHEIKEGKTELEIVAAIEYAMKQKGISEMSFATTVLAGAKAASPHGVPGLNKIEKGNLILFDLGVVHKGYCSDITRTVAFGELNEEQIRIYETVLKAEEAAVKAAKPGVKAKELDQIARSIIHDAGYGEYFTHRLGHGLGISIHEYPSVTITNELVLQEGMVFTIEPGIYVPGVAGVRIEDDVCITENGAEVLTKYPKMLQYV
ncbi:Xaa-Pro dipeptidase [Weizmannia acidilactici]|uniref:Xaa-Pro dipeptidase n=1 Tax=Weizmannia acidilactici TaxID=2607726 RepID=A0A5J4JHJ5_9BACI|nr:Xaa-Pro peptidase family protein [Weizmannia acidilactici]GER66999.1 Xaa-Pro dipeptidase [Weizmannia acidilactici]GER70155.1 Xaa-Pro dipeptidase [Weizmannia acidilactici]